MCINPSDRYYSSGNVQYLNRVLEDLWLEEKCQKYFERIKCYAGLETGTIADFSEAIAENSNYCSQTRSAFLHWTSLPQEDRLSVLQTYYRLFRTQLSDFSDEQIVLMFCQLFLAEFVPRLHKFALSGA